MLRKLRLIAAGVTPEEIDTMPAAMAQALRADCLGAWLPLAMADLCTVIAGFCGVKEANREGFLESRWLVTAAEKAREREAAPGELDWV